MTQSPSDHPRLPARHQAMLAATALAAAWCIFLLISASLPDGFAVSRMAARGALGGLVACAITAGVLVRRDGAASMTSLSITALAAIAGTMLFSHGFVLLDYLLLPVDLLSFSESSFVNDIIKFRTGTPIYTPVTDNSAYPYTPGAPILTYLIASLFSEPLSIPALRLVQIAYVITGAIVATLATRRLAERLLPQGSTHATLWCAAWFPLLMLVATAPLFNAYNHSLHNDGLALCLSMIAFYLLVRHIDRPSATTLAMMAVLPVAGFLVKQSLLIWVALFAWSLLISGTARWRQVIVVVGASGLLVAASIVLGYRYWGGEDFMAWLFKALGDKQVSVARSLEHLIAAGSYVAMGIGGVWATLVRRADRGTFALVSTGAILLCVEAYTSGIGFAANHLGPAVMLATAFMLSVLPAYWDAGAPDAWSVRTIGARAAAPAFVAFAFMGLGLFVRPSKPVPADFARYTAEIEREFEGMDASRVLMDFGSWIYLRHDIVMKDRSDPVALHAGRNSPTINRAMLAQTIARIDARSYDKILTRAIDTPESQYDFQDAGSGVKAAILRSYVIVRRIRPVQGVSRWWPLSRLAEVDVLVPRPVE